DYTVTGSNSGGATSVVVNITVVDQAPAGLTYSTNPAIYTVNTAIANNTPSSTGGAITAYSVTPDLPAGLAIDAATGIISGTPTALSPATDYTVTGSNSGGATSVVVNITVVDQAPAGLTYSTNPAIYTVNTAIANNTPSSTGGAITAYSVTPDLPAGLAIDAATGIISGTPAAVSPATDYTVTGSNSGGATTVVVNIAVVEQAPAGLKYSTNPAVYTVNTATASNTPSSTGGAITAYSVTPDLPAGLAIDAATGIISGTPTAVSPATDYTVTGSNSGGATTVVVNIAVVDQA